MTAGPNSTSAHELDDALYHWYVLLEEGMTLEECIRKSVDIGMNASSFTRKLKDSDTNIEFYNLDLSDQQRDIFKKMVKELTGAFHYAVNVVLYATHPDAEQEVFNANPQYQALYHRAHKAKGKKRKELFSRLNAIKGPDRILLGKSIVVSREEREALAADTRKGSKHSVRSFVAAHWQHYWTGPLNGERTRKYLLKSAYWKGAPDAPIAKPVHHVQ